MWTTENRARYDRSKLRYPSDLTDDKWRLIKPLERAPGSAQPGQGRVQGGLVVLDADQQVLTAAQMRA